MAKFILGWPYIFAALWMAKVVFVKPVKSTLTLVALLITISGSAAMGCLMIFFGAMDLYRIYGVALVP